ncbi:hypothetical protein ACFSUS_02225 [Spirosoma soli]|uniref:Uncharacterized protein n=1 Tax=Spirosoma soli TaxID=1770529 RepID=A0ABW5LYU5_9BACT
MKRWGTPLHHYVRYIAYLLVITPILLYSYVFLKSLVNFPFYDDFFWYNKLILRAEGQPLLTKLALITEQHSDHRLILLKGLALLLSSIGTFDFRAPILLTNCLFLLFSIHLIVHVYHVSKHWFFTVPCLFILYQFIPYTVVFSYGLQTLGVLLFLYFALYYVWLTSRWSYGLTALMALLCVLSNTNGLLVLPILALVYFLTHRYQVAALYISLTVLIPAVYFSFGYQWNAGAVQYTSHFSKPVNTYLFLAELIGTWANLSHAFGYAMAVTVGTLLLLLIAWSLVGFVRSVNWRSLYVPPVTGASDTARHLILTATFMLGFILLTCLLLSYKRFAGTEHTNNVVPHYRQYSMFALCFCYVLGVAKIAQSRWLWSYAVICAVLSITGNIASYLYIHDSLRQYTLALRADVYNWQHNQSFLFFPHVEGEVAWQTVTTEMATNYQKHLIVEPPPTKPVHLISSSLSATVCQRDHEQVITLTDPATPHSYLSNVFLVLKNQQATYFFPFVNTLNSPRTILKQAALVSSYGQSAISHYICKDFLPCGSYQPFLYNEDLHTLQRINTTVTIFPEANSQRHNRKKVINKQIPIALNQ